MRARTADAAGTDVEELGAERVESDVESGPGDAEVEAAMGAELIVRDTVEPKRRWGVYVCTGAHAVVLLTLVVLVIVLFTMLSSIANSTVPAAPGTGIYVLASVDGDIFWVDQGNSTT